MEEAKPQILLWTVAECPFRVTIPAAVLNEIRILAVEAFYSVPRGGVEIGGIFFGVCEPNAIHIQAYRPIRCEYASGPSFTLSIKDQLGLVGLLEGVQGEPDLAGMTPLGWYHSHTRSEIFLSPADVQFYNEFFHEKWQVALVLRPANLQPTRAGFFFRDRWGHLKSDSPLEEFKLEPPDFGLTVLEPHDAPALPSAPPLIAQGAPGAAQVLHPIRQAPAAEQATLAVRETAIAAPEPLPAAVVPAAGGNGSAVISEEAPITAIPYNASLPIPVPEPDVPADLGLPSFNLAQSAVKEKWSAGWIWALAVLILVAVAGSAAFLKWGRIARPSDLGLETYDVNGAFLIRWDRGSDAVLLAKHATLEIEDGGEKIPIELTPAELAVGGYGYMRRTAQVSVHMKVDGPSPQEEYSNFEGVQAVGSQPTSSADTSNILTQALEEKEHLKTELINESMQSSELRREITTLRKQLAEERSRAASKSR